MCSNVVVYTHHLYCSQSPICSQILLTYAGDQMYLELQFYYSLQIISLGMIDYFYYFVILYFIWLCCIISILFQLSLDSFSEHLHPILLLPSWEPDHKSRGFILSYCRGKKKSGKSCRIRWKGTLELIKKELMINWKQNLLNFTTFLTFLL